jgi:hypothetical protein
MRGHVLMPVIGIGVHNSVLLRNGNRPGFNIGIAERERWGYELRLSLQNAQGRPDLKSPTFFSRQSFTSEEDGLKLFTL